MNVCPVCGEKYWNRGAHAEACTGPPPVREPDQFATDDDGA